MKATEGLTEEEALAEVLEDLDVLARVEFGDPLGEVLLTVEELACMEREVAAGKRQRLAKGGKALPDGSFPMETPGDVRNARRAVGRAHPGKRPAVRRLIKKREKALGMNGGTS
jgi:hypothetical protein